MIHVEFDINWIEILKYTSGFIVGAVIVAAIFVKIITKSW